MYLSKDGAITTQGCFIHPQVELLVSTELLTFKYFHSLA